MDKPPDVVGLSLLHAGQVSPAVGVTSMCRRLWPRALVVWGGPHISGLGESVLRSNIAEGNSFADAYVVGHAERTFVDILDMVQDGKSKGIPILMRGYSYSGSSLVGPSFEGLDAYDEPLTFPAQSSVGCSYGRCTYCTYPATEPVPKMLSLDTVLEPVVQTALQHTNAAVALKDSLVTSGRLQAIGNTIRGRTKWSACTKLSQKLTHNATLLQELDSNGLATLEVGLETVLPTTQKKIQKVQSKELYNSFLEKIADLDISVVVNYMTGFPWEDPEEAEFVRQETESILTDRVGSKGMLEHNCFGLERMSPMGRRPSEFGIPPGGLRYWPWASVIEMRDM